MRERLRRWRTFATYVLIGTLGTGAYIGLYFVLDLLLPRSVPAGPRVATVVAWFVATIGTNLVHRRVTFAVTTPRRRGVDAAVQFATSLLGLGASAAMIEASHMWGAAWHAPMLVAGTALGGVVRFVAMRIWFDTRAPERMA